MQGHNIPVPPAAVDQKILKQGYFPVYISCHGKPCLLFLVEYTVDPYISSQLQALCNTGMTVVVNPTDPNCTSLMLSDYFGLPNDAIKVMNHNGRVAYENESVAADSSSAFASFTDSICGMFSAITSSIKLNSVITTLTAIFIIAAVLSVAATTVFAIIGKLAIINSLTFAAFQLLFAAIIFIISRIKI